MTDRTTVSEPPAQPRGASILTDVTSRRRRPVGLVTAAAIALALSLSACVPTITIETRGTVRVTPVTSGVLLIVRVPSPHPRGGIEVTKANGRSFTIPPGHFPPPGSCRIWYPDEPPGQQPPPGSCSELERRVPAGAYLVYG